MIELENLTVAYGRTVAVADLTLTIGPGITGLFGPNAAGKSTLLRTIAGLETPTRGRVSIAGVRSPRDLRARLGWVGHTSGLYARLTLRENLLLFGSLNGATAASVEEGLTALHLGEYGNVRIADLSAGTKRRAAVARALLHSPSVLLLDEPYANLDDESAEVVSDALVAWAAADRTRCGVIASHGAKRVKAFATGSLILQRGRAVSYRTREHE